jgi:hypothetical protein
MEKTPLSEADLTKLCVDFMEARGWRALRHQRTIVRGQFQTGEPGIPDYQFIYYLKEHSVYGFCLNLYVEFKRKSKTAQCRCAANAGSRRRCTFHDQVEWQARERAAGGAVWVIDDFADFEASYRDMFGSFLREWAGWMNSSTES